MKAAIAITAFLTACTPAMAQQGCAPHERVAGMLGLKHQEVMQASAAITLNIHGDAVAYVLEIWANEETGTFTIVRTSPRGTACSIIAGKSFQLKNSDRAVVDDET